MTALHANRVKMTILLVYVWDEFGHYHSAHGYYSYMAQGTATPGTNFGADLLDNGQSSGNAEHEC